MIVTCSFSTEQAVVGGDTFVFSYKPSNHISYFRFASQQVIQFLQWKINFFGGILYTDGMLCLTSFSLSRRSDCLTLIKETIREVLLCSISRTIFFFLPK